MDDTTTVRQFFHFQLFFEQINVNNREVVCFLIFDTNRMFSYLELIIVIITDFIILVFLHLSIGILKKIPKNKMTVSHHAGVRRS